MPADHCPSKPDFAKTANKHTLQSSAEVTYILVASITCASLTAMFDSWRV